MLTGGAAVECAAEACQEKDADEPSLLQTKSASQNRRGLGLPEAHRDERGEEAVTFSPRLRAARSGRPPSAARPSLAQRRSKPKRGRDAQYTCGLKEDSKLLLMVSSSGVRGPDIKTSLDGLVSALPAAGGTADYSKLKLLEIYDPCMLKTSFWDEANSNFNAETGMNYQKANISNLTPDLVEPFDYVGPDTEMLDPSWCYNEWTASSATGGLSDLGFASHTTVSIMDHMMEPDEFKALVRADLGETGAEDVEALVAKLQERPVPDALKQLIGEADVIAASGGNPDLATFVFRAFPAVAELLKSKLEAGEAVYMGRSAGGMVTGALATFSSEPTPEMLENVLASDPTGLELLPECIVKPHFKTESHEAYASALEKGSGFQVVRMPNYMALSCKSGSCVLQGSPKPEDLQWKNAQGYYLGHLDGVYDDLVGVPPGMEGDKQ